MSYDVTGNLEQPEKLVTNNNNNNNNNNDDDDDNKIIGRKEGDHRDGDIDPDIRSIMIANDKLVEQLANSVKLEDQLDGPLPLPLLRLRQRLRSHSRSRPRTQQTSQHGRGPNSNRKRRNEQDYDHHDVDKLNRLVRKTMSEEDKFSPDLVANSLPSLIGDGGEDDCDGDCDYDCNCKDGKDGQEGEKNVQLTSYQANEASSGGGGGGGGANQSYSSTTKKRTPFRHDHNHHRSHHHNIPSSGSSSSSSGSNIGQFNVHRYGSSAKVLGTTSRQRERAGEKVYANCNDMPVECESGGQCVTEEITTRRSGEVEEDNDTTRVEEDNEPTVTTTTTTTTTTSNTQLLAARCRCPIGRGGFVCQKPIQREVPRFLGHSYLALPLDSAHKLASMRLIFKPDNRRQPSKQQQQRQQLQQPLQFLSSSSSINSLQQHDEESIVDDKRSLLLHSSEFALFLDDSMSRIELQYLTRASDGQEEKQHQYDDAGSSDNNIHITRVMGSRDVKLGEWNELIVIDATTNANNVDDNDNNIPSYNDDESRLFRRRLDIRNRSRSRGRGRRISGSDETLLDDCDVFKRVTNRIVLVTPNKIGPLSAGPSIRAKNHAGNYSSGQLFVAGLPESLWSSQQSSSGSSKRLSVASVGGFRGCIKELSINGREYNFRSDLNGDTLDGFDVVECCDVARLDDN